jgi:hypothetical protein
MTTRLLSVVVTSALLTSACFAPRPWWERELKAWEGATLEQILDGWGPPVRTITDKDGRPTLVYESYSVIDTNDEQLLDPNIVLREDRPVQRTVDERECTMLLVMENDVVVDTEARGAGCAVPIRDL